MTELIQMERLMERFPVLEGCREEIWRAYEILKRTYEKKGMLLVCGNGGSGADSEHIVGELMKEFAIKRPLPKEERQRLEDISDEIDREGKIIDDLLSLVKMDKSEAELNIAHVDINQLVEQVLKRLRPIANRRKVELIYESIRQVTADVDETKLSLVITNLVENAMKYNIEEGWVRVTVDADHKFFYLKVADSGIGIPEEMQDQIFDRFFRVDKARSRESGGTGLGLSIAREIVQRHHGTIALAPHEGPGTTIRLTLPIGGPSNPI